MVALAIEPGTAQQQVFMGEVSGNNVVNAVWTEGSNVSHSAGVSIIDYVTATQKAAETKGILVEHNQSGTHAAVTATSVTSSGAVSGTTVTGSGAVTGAGLVSTNTTATRKDQSGNTIAIDPVYRNEGFQGFDFVLTGLDPSSAVALLVTIPAGTYYIAGKRYTYAGGTKTLGASKDCYLDIDTSGTITSVEVANGATSGMTLTSNAVRFAKIVTGGASVSSYNTGTVLSTYFDSLGNPIRRTRPNDKLIGYAQSTSDFTTASGSVVDVTGINCKAIVPSATSTVIVRAGASKLTVAGGTATVDQYINDVTGTANVDQLTVQTNGISLSKLQTNPLMPGAGTRNYKMQMNSSGGLNATLTGGAAPPIYIAVYLT